MKAEGFCQWNWHISVKNVDIFGRLVRLGQHQPRIKLIKALIS
jgi:hypothetical protein